MKPNWIVLVGLGVVVSFLAFWFWPASGPEAPPAGEAEAVETPIHFEDVTSAAGITFVHHDGATDMHYIQETIGSGVGWIDYDGDGWQDLFCVQGGPVFPDPTRPRPTSRLYRNRGGNRFVDVTEQVGLDQPGYGMGCAVGDFDNDGFDDLVVTYFRGIRLYHNQADGKGGRRFVDITKPAGLDNPHWATSCAWGDIDNDGWLDLYVCNYVEVDLEHYQPCVHPTLHLRHVCHPRVFPAARDCLFRNQGNGTFAEISQSSGITQVEPQGPGLAVAMLDLDGDGKLDIYVANDMAPAFLFHNQGQGKFVEKGVLSGCGLETGGGYLAGMGIAAGDVDDSGRPSLLVTNYQDEPNYLFLNRGNLVFADATHTSGLGPPSIPFLAFGVVLFDADLDGALDVAIANGHVYRNAEQIRGAPFKQTAQFFQGSGTGTFQEITSGVGPYFRRRLAGRGLARADFDRDGRPDLVFSHNGGPLVLLRNTTTSAGNGIQLELVGDGLKSNRNAIGAVVEVEAGGKRQVYWVQGGGSYLSASSRTLLIGLGATAKAERLRVTWPSGDKQEFADLAAGKAYRLFEGRPEPEEILPAR
jgi:hypothetical protein